MQPPLLDGLAFLADHPLVGVADAFAFIGFGRIEGADLGSDLADDLPIRTFNGQLGVFLDRDLDLGRNGINDRMRITETQIDGIALNSSLETDALDLEL